MDIPDFEELEWLESHTSNEQLFDDDDFDIDIEIEPPDEHESPIKRPTLSLPSNPSSALYPNSQINNPNAKKRLRSCLPDSTSFDVDHNSDPAKDGKRIRTEDDEFSDAAQILLNQNVGSLEKSGGSDDDDEECQRCSPPRSTEGEEEMMDVVEVQTEERIISRYLTEIDGDCVPVTGLDGERVYAKICSANMDADNRRNKLCVRGEFNGLLREPVRDLMQKFEHEEFTKALQASVEGPTELVPPEAPVTNEQLWVDKYAPSSFTELLSDEQTNREVLLWLKQWDPSVFGSEIKSTTEDVLSALRRHSLGSQHLKQSTKSYSGNNRGTRSNYFGNNREIRFSRDNMRAHNELDKENNISQGTPEIWDKRQKGFGTPEQKILLLCGPPGLGKTTLAHVAARHCGYRVVEINASDDRSSSVIEAKILDVVQMNSVISDSKPKCLVIDEIDGALGDGKGAVEIILKLLSAEKKSDTGKGNAAQGTHSDRKSSQKKQKNSLLLRPVICICNDLYAPALRPLRQVAKVHIFVQPTVSRVVNRLKYICNKEGVKTSSIALTTLAEYTECDIRSCLNTLQFLNKKKEILNVLEISSQVVGRKDVSKSAFDVWKEIFQKRKGKRDRKSNNSGGSMSKDFEFLYSLISNRGDYDLIFDGIHENILQLHYVDPMMQKTVQCLDNLVVSDMNHRYIMRTQQMSLQVYQPPIAIRMHSLIAQLEKKNIEWPKSFHRHRTVLTERLAMFQAWHNKISPYISRHLSTKSFVEDSISSMLHILSPPTLRPVALHLLSDNEKSCLGQLVNIMVSYAITYKNIKFERSGISRHEDALDTSTLSFDPPISEFIQLKDYNSCHYDLALAVKKVLVHEVEKQKILLGSISKYTDLQMKENHALEKNTCNGKSFKSSNVNGPANKKMDGKSPIIAERSGLPISSSSSAAEQSGDCATQVKSVQKIKRPSGGVTNFFDRFRKTSNEGCRNSNNAVQRGGTVQRDLHPLLFKFNEGFTNAVKRPVRVREFLL